MIDINNIKGLQELFAEKAFAVASTEKLIEDIYPIVMLTVLYDETPNEIVWDICAEIISAIQDYQLYKFYADKFHYSIFYDFEEDELHVIEKHADPNNLISNVLKGQEFTFNGKSYTVDYGKHIYIIFEKEWSDK